MDTLEQFQSALTGTPMAGHALVALQVLDTPEQVYAMRTNARDMEAMWRCARALVDKTGRWPLVTQLWTDDDEDLATALEQADLFSRFEYMEAPNTDDVSPRALIAASDVVDVDAFVDRMEADHNEGRSSEDIYLDYARSDTLRRCGHAPSMEELQTQQFATGFELERWMFEWELRNGGIGKPEEGRPPFFELDGPAILLFLPTPHPWNALAYISWYGTSRYGSEHYIALGRRWQQRYGAELFAHFGTMLECFAETPTEDIEDAFKLAREHDLAGSCTLSGTTLRNYAAGLLGYDRWFLHERP
ncbi:MAG: DUF4253 domain-containing protein [Burkholderiaceae bacterium]|nr:DUF4253 domain-containing protein [Burkholderiaceae bacterium]